MQKFSGPPYRVKFSRMEDDIHKNFRLFSSFPIHSIQLLVPSSKPIELDNILTSDDDIYFKIKDVSISAFLKTEFIEHFINKGSLSAVTLNANTKTENFLALAPSGKLILSLKHDIAKYLALNKKNPNKKKKKEKDFAVYVFDMKSLNSTSEKKNYEKIVFELSKMDDIHFTVLLKWLPKESNCSHSLKTYFDSCGYKCFVCEPKHKHSSKLCVAAPEIRPEIAEQDNQEEILEWIGTQICGIDYCEPENNYDSKFCIPEPNSIIDQLSMDSWEGFYTNEDVLKLLKEMKKLPENDSSVPFVVISISGYQDCYLECQGFEQFSNDDKLINIIIFPSDYWIMTLNCR